MSPLPSVETEALLAEVSTAVVAGFTASDREASRAHLLELSRVGIEVPDEVPAFYDVPSSLVRVTTSLQTSSHESSGEVEPVLLVVDGEWWLTVGSDHTLRDVERRSIPDSKRACAKPVAGRAWRYADALARLDSIRLVSRVRSSDGWVEYQRSPIDLLMSAETIVENWQSANSIETFDNAVFFLGTVPLLSESFVAGDRFLGSMEEHTSKSSLTVEYDVVVTSTREMNSV